MRRRRTRSPRARSLLAQCREHGLEMYELVLANERTWASEAQVRAKLLHLWQVMQACVERGFRQTGLLPGSSRCAAVRAPLPHADRERKAGPLDVMDWVNAYALAVMRRTPPAAAWSPRRPTGCGHRARRAALLSALRAGRER